MLNIVPLKIYIVSKPMFIVTSHSILLQISNEMSYQKPKSDFILKYLWSQKLFLLEIFIFMTVQSWPNVQKFQQIMGRAMNHGWFVNDVRCHTLQLYIGYELENCVTAVQCDREMYGFNVVWWHTNKKRKVGVCVSDY